MFGSRSLEHPKTTMYNIVYPWLAILAKYYTDSDVFLPDSLGFADSWDFLLIAWRFFHGGWVTLETTSGHTAGPVFFLADNTQPRKKTGSGVCPDVLCYVIQSRWKKWQATQQKVQATQPNPSYSGKDNVAIRMIATFPRTRFFSWLSIFLAYQPRKKTGPAVCPDVVSNVTQPPWKTSSYQQKVPAISKFHAIRQKNVAICIIDDRI